MAATGIIFSNIHDNNIPELTRLRTLASVPFGCRYRLVDFTLSNMVNSNIYNVDIITHYNYQSLMDHLGSGKDWDLARRSGGIKILPPFITAYDSSAANMLYTTRLEALMGVMNFISRCNEDYIVLSDCDTICNIDMKAVLEMTEESKADMTIVSKNTYIGVEDAGKYMILTSDPDGRITDITEHGVNTTGFHDICLNIMVLKRSYLHSILLDAMAHGYKHFFKDVIVKNLSSDNIRIYNYDGYYSSISSLVGYFSCSMELLKNEVRADLFGNDQRPIFTKVRNSAPTKYMANANVVNSLVADGCIIEGTVENSILFRGVKIGKNTVVRNSIMFQDSFTGNNVSLNCVITDKNVIIRDGRQLSGHETLPFFIEKGVMI